MSQQKNEPDVRFWLSRKFWMAMVAAMVFTAFGISKTVVFSSMEVMTFVLGLAGMSIGGHVITDVASLITSVIEGNKIRDKQQLVFTTTEDMTIPAGTTYVESQVTKKVAE